MLAADPKYEVGNEKTLYSFPLAATEPLVFHTDTDADALELAGGIESIERRGELTNVIHYACSVKRKKIRC